MPVEISDVRPGTMVFPLCINITDEKGRTCHVVHMNVGTAGMESRTFQNIFSLSDPKERYPGIDKEVWSLIQQEK